MLNYKMKTEIENWIKQAERDLKTAKNSLEKEDYYASVFWCQQSVEKILKAILIKEKNVLIKIHDLVVLGKKAGLPKKYLDFLKELNEGYIDSRYGIGDDEIPAERFDKEDADKFIEIAEEVLEWVKKKI